MYLADYHVHTAFSFDYDKSADGTPLALCRRALDAGLSEIAFTDHYDINFILDGTLPDIDLQARSAQIAEAKERFAGKLTVVHGIELGQPTQREEEAGRFLRENSFDFVIGSLHNNAGKPDFYDLDYAILSTNEILRLIEDYLNETLLHIRWGKGRFHTLAHLNYPLRYIRRDGAEARTDLDCFQEVYREILRLLVEEGIALELNTSGFRKGMEDTVPASSFARLYRELGGELFTVGSDAHTPALIGDHIRETYEFLRSIGVRKIAAFENGTLTLKPIL